MLHQGGVRIGEADLVVALPPVAVAHEIVRSGSPFLEIQSPFSAFFARSP